MRLLLKIYLEKFIKSMIAYLRLCFGYIFKKTNARLIQTGFSNTVFLNKLRRNQKPNLLTGDAALNKKKRSGSNEGSRKKTQKKKARKKPQAKQFCCITIKKTKNNIFCNISNLFGRQKTVWSISGGQIKGCRNNGQRKSLYIQRLVFKNAVKKVRRLGFKYLVIHCSGPALSKRYIFKNFWKRKSFRILMLKDFTNVAHNGCRPRGVRRV